MCFLMPLISGQSPFSAYLFIFLSSTSCLILLMHTSLSCAPLFFCFKPPGISNPDTLQAHTRTCTSSLESHLPQKRQGGHRKSPANLKQVFQMRRIPSRRLPGQLAICKHAFPNIHLQHQRWTPPFLFNPISLNREVSEFDLSLSLFFSCLFLFTISCFRSL